MSISDEAQQYAKQKVTQLLDQYCKIPIRATTPINFYYKSSDNLIDEADYFYAGRHFEQSFILYSRYITLFVEAIKTHPYFNSVSNNDRERVKEIMRAKALPRAEELKAKLKEKYFVEYETMQRAKLEEENAKLAALSAPKPMVNIHQENQSTFEQLKANHAQLPQLPPGHMALFAVPKADQNIHQIRQEPNLPTFDRSQKPMMGSGMGALRPISVPDDITQKFLQVAQTNTMRQIETCGILAGSKRGNQYVITHIVIPKQNGGPDSCDTEKEEEMLEYIFNHDLIQLGWIHTHPTQTVFLSSVDLHTHLPYQMLMQEAIAIVISPKYNETAIYSLTPDVGISAISTCKKTGFHEHTNPSAIYVPSPHARYDKGLQCEIIDLRN